MQVAKGMAHFGGAVQHIIDLGQFRQVLTDQSRLHGLLSSLQSTKAVYWVGGTVTSIHAHSPQRLPYSHLPSFFIVLG